MAIQLTGLMVGTYILVKRIQLLANKSEQAVTKVFASINIIVTFFFMLGIMASGASMFRN